jgi:hypothetical protein
VGWFSFFFHRLRRIADSEHGANPIDLTDTDRKSKLLGKLRLDLVARDRGSLATSFFQKRAHFAPQFDRVPMSAFLQRLLSTLTHPLAEPIGRRLTDR